VKFLALNLKKWTKYLGVEIDHRWKFKDHINDLIKKLRQMLPKLYFVKNVLNSPNKLILYDAWIASHLRYATELYGFANATDLKRLQKVQNKIVKVLFANRWIHKSKNLLKFWKILNVKQLNIYSIAIKYFYEMKDKRKTKIDAKNYMTKSTILEVPIVKNKYGEKRADYYVPFVLNKLPEDVWKIDKIGALKKRVKSWLIENEI